jgi:hypothetical protein
MIESLKGFKRSTALGVLSRAALALLSSEANPSALPSIENELSIREKIIFELAGQMGLSALDLTDQGTRERLSEALDHEAEALDPDVDFESAIQRLSERGQLPSDLFDISISEELLRIGYGDRAEQERKYILDTIRSPHSEQHFPVSTADHPTSVSLFGRDFPAKPRRAGFYHVVTGLRIGPVLDVRQAWRMYEDEIDLVRARTLRGALQSFAERYGVMLKIDRQIGKFIYFATVAPGQSHEAAPRTSTFIEMRGVPIELLETFPSEQTQVSAIMLQRPDGVTEISFAMAINLRRYSAVVHRRDALKEQAR